MPTITPFTMPTKGSRRPKSVVSVMSGRAAMTARPWERDRRPSTVAIDDEVGDQRQCLLVFRILERAERVLRPLRIAVGALKRVFDALVLRHEPTDLLDVLRLLRAVLQQQLDTLLLGR